MDRRTFLALAAATACVPRKPAPRAGEEWRIAQSTDAGAQRETLEEADRQIKSIRHGRALLRIADVEGRPLAGGTALSVEYIRPDFIWGYSSIKDIRKTSTDSLAYRRAARLARTFSSVTCKCYWDERWHQPIEHHLGKREYGLFDAEIESALRLGQLPKGHPLVWTVPKALPPWVKAAPPGSRMALLEAHVRGMIRHAAGRVPIWDLANEMLWEPTLAHTEQRRWPHLEPAADIAADLSQAFRWAREEQPGGLFGLNDYGLETTYRPEVSAEAQRQRYVELASRLADLGTPPGYIGTQAHVGEPYGVATFTTMLADLAKSGLPVHITEFWANARRQNQVPDERDAEYVDGILRVAYAQRALRYFSFWHTGDDMLLPGSAEPTVMLQTLEKLVWQGWATPKQQLYVSQDGTVQLDAWQGHHQVSLADGRKAEALLGPGRGTVQVQL